MSIYLTGGEMYGSSEIILEENRPFMDQPPKILTTDDMDKGIYNVPYEPNVQWMNETMISNHNRFVGDGDTVIHIGNFGDLSEVSKLYGRHILILGENEKKIRRQVYGNGTNNFKKAMKELGWDDVWETPSNYNIPITEYHVPKKGYFYNPLNPYHLEKSHGARGKKVDNLHISMEQKWDGFKPNIISTPSPENVSMFGINVHVMANFYKPVRDIHDIGILYKKYQDMMRG